MPRVDVVVETPLSRSSRVRQLEGMFDVPAAEKCRLEWHADIPIEDEPWNVGLIVGPSGSGKTTIARHLFGEGKLQATASMPWRPDHAVIDDFNPDLTITEISEVCQAVGFNTIPAWMRPFHVLSNGEQFRVSLARAMLEEGDPIIFDEFTSVVDRQVAKIGSHAVQKFIRKKGRRFVAVTCHHDVIDWLQPDWIFVPAERRFERRRLRQRPQLDITISPVPYAAWSLFAPFHYLTANLHRAAQCWGLFVGGRVAAFTAIMRRPHAQLTTLAGFSRTVCLPDFQGLGLAPRLVDTVAGVYKAAGFVVHSYPAHLAYARTRDRSPNWALKRKPGVIFQRTRSGSMASREGGRPCATFAYIGPAIDLTEAVRVLSYWPGHWSHRKAMQRLHDN